MELQVVKRDGSVEPLSLKKIHAVTEWACQGLDVSQSELETSAHLMFFNGIKTSDIHDALIQSAASLIGLESQDYTYVAARLLLQKLYKEVTGGGIQYPMLRGYIEKGVSEGRLTEDILEKFDLERLDRHIRQERDLLFTYVGLQTLADRYLIRETQKVGETARIIELPQHFWMRVAMGLALNEGRPTERAIEFYEVLSSLQYVASTPTLFNSGTNHSQMSSCYLNTVSDEIGELGGDKGIFNTITECANLSKFAGGIGTDWTRVRPAGDPIHSTNGKSSGVVPYLKIFNDTAVAVNQGGKRNGAFASYLEPWHPDLYDFCDLKKNSGDERRRAHDIFPALWMPDLFFKRVKAQGVWSFFSPAEFPELHELYGVDFENRYEQLEREGKFRRQLPAMEVWKRILTSLFETGHPWITYKDECNRRNPQDHAGVIHCSNLCTEITLNTSDDETAVCNLGSVNLSRIESSEHLRRVIRTAMRMLDNVIDINFYPSDKAKNANLRHRPVGLGVMGYMEFLVKNGIDFESAAHLDAADEVFEEFSYYAIEASCALASERGAYGSFEGSKWHRGILPIDTARYKDSRMDWASLRAKVSHFGMRNSNTMAIAPTATISLIAGTTQCIEPVFLREYSKTNLSGTFKVIDPTLKYGRHDLCKEAFEVDPRWVVRAAAIRQKWLDQSQSVNIFVKGDITGPDLAEIYMKAWEFGLKTTYYLRTLAAEVKEEEPKRDDREAYIPLEGKTITVDLNGTTGKFCTIEDFQSGCESCQ